MLKKEIRKSICSIRSKFSRQKQTLASQQVKYHLCNLTIFQTAKNLGVYWPNKREIDTIPIIEHAIQFKKPCFLPVLNPIGKNDLFFLPYTEKTNLTPNKFNIPEPEYNDKLIMPIENLSLLLLPLVAFDCHGYRLGMGKGFYDKTLNKIISATTRPAFIGLAYAMQEVDPITCDLWDVKLDGVVTEDGVKIFSKNKFN